MAAALASLLLVAYVPGALIYRIPFADRATRAQLPAEERVFWGVMLSAAISTAVVLVLAAFGAYTFPRLLLVNGSLAGLVLAVWRGRLRYRGAATRPGWPALVPVALVALGIAVFFPPSEYIMGGKDPGVYMNEGVQIAQRGSLTIPDWTLAAVPADLRELFLTSLPREGSPEPHEGVRFMGFFVENRERGEVVGQFPHGFPAWIAIGYGLDGLTGARRAVGFWAILGVLALYAAGSRLCGRLPAAAGAALLSLNVAQVWFGRYPNSEVMQQALFFAAMLALARSLIDGQVFFAPAAGALLGLMLFTRFDTVILLAAVGGGLVLTALGGIRIRASLFVPLIGLIALAVPYYATLMRAYISIPLLKLGGWQGLAAVASAIALGLWLARLAAARLPAATRHAQAWLPRLLVAVILIAVVYGAFLREPFDTVYDGNGIVVWQGVAEHDAYALRVYAWYVGALGLWAAVAGFAVLGRGAFWRDPVLLSVTAAVSLFFFYKIRIVPEHFWQARRYLPVILPMTCLLAAAAAFALSGLWSRARTGTRRDRIPAVLLGLVAPTLVLGLLGWQYARQTKPILDHVEYAGLIPSIEKLAVELSDRDLVLVESRNASDVHVLATPLAYIYAKNVLLLSSARPDREQFARLLDWAGRTYDRVVFLADGGTDLANPRLRAVPIGMHRFQVAEYESTRHALPRDVRPKKFSVGLYSLALGASPVMVRDLDIGGFDDPWVLRMHAKEQGEGTTYRWTRDVSYVSLQGITATDRAVILRLHDGGRPAAAGTATIDVLLNGAPLGGVTVEGPWRDYVIPLPADVSATAAAREEPSVLRLVSSTWTPRAVLGGPDDRALGVMLDRVRIE